MNANLQRPVAITIDSAVTKAATYTGTAVDAPLSDSYAFYVDVTAGSGTSPTMDLCIQVTPDNGTTWIPAARFAQITGVVKRRLQLQPVPGRGEAGAEAAVANTGGALATNTVLSKKIRVVNTIGGTNPSFTYSLYMFAVPRSTGD